MKRSRRDGGFQVKPGPAPWRNDHDTEPVRYGKRSTEDCETDSARRGVFRNNRGLLITLIDLGFVAILLVLYLAILRPMADRVMIDPYIIDLEASREGNTAIIIGTISVANPVFGPSPVLPPEQPIVTLTAGNGSVSDLAPKRDTDRTLLLEIPYSTTSEGKIEVEVNLGGKRGVQVIELR